MTPGRLRIIAIAAVILAAGIGLWLWLSPGGETRSGTLVLHGNVDIREVDLSFNGSEHIASILVREGDRVKKGQLLATLDTGRLRPAVTAAEAQLQAQAQVVARMEAGSRPEEIRRARADVDAAQADATNAESIYKRRIPLAAKKVISPEQVEDARAAAEAAKARLRSAREILALALAGPRKEDIAAAKQTLRAYQADLALRQKELADAALHAPDDGVIRNRILEPGDMASPQQPVLTLALTNPVWVRAYVSETELGRIRPGMSAEVSTDSYPGKRYSAWIGFISPTAEFTPKSVETREVRTSLVYQVRVYVCNPEDQLRLGMPATVSIPLQQPAAKAKAGADRCQER